MVGFGPHLFPCKEGGSVVQPPHHRQIALAHVHPDDSLVGVGRGVCYFHLQGDKQIELLLGFVIPEFGRADLGSLLDQRYMRVIASVGHDHAPVKRQDAHPLARLQAVIAMEVIGDRRGDIVGRRSSPL